MGTAIPVPLPQEAATRPQWQQKQEAVLSAQSPGRRKCSLWRLSPPSPARLASPSSSSVCSGIERRAQQQPHNKVGRSPSQLKTVLATQEETAEQRRTVAPKVEHCSPVPAPSLGQVTARADSSSDIKHATSSPVLSGDVSRQTELCGSPESELHFLQSS